MLTDQELDKALASRKFPRVTKEYIDGHIASTDFYRIGGTVSVCSITLFNGYSVRGESACVDPRNFNEDLGKRLAYDDAYRKLWPLFGFLLAERRARPLLSAEDIASVCHEVNRAYCTATGDNSQPSWSAAPDWQRTSALEGVRQALMDPDTTPEASHAGWLKIKLADGWTYGPVKDPEKKTHPCILPYDQLPPEQRVKDHLFLAVVRAMQVLG